MSDLQKLKTLVTPNTGKAKGKNIKEVGLTVKSFKKLSYNIKFYRIYWNNISGGLKKMRLLANVCAMLLAD